MATVAEEKAPLTASLGENPALKKAAAKLASGPPRPRQQQNQRKERRGMQQGWQTPQQPQPQQPLTTAAQGLQEKLQQAQLTLQLKQISDQLNPPEPEGLWQKFLYGIGMLFAAKAVDRILAPKPVWRKHPGRVAAVGVLAAAFVAFLGWKATRPLE